MKYAYFKGKIVPFAEAKISIMTHAFNYGTAVFEGIRAYWNQGQHQMYILKNREHYERLQRSASANESPEAGRRPGHGRASSGGSALL